VLKGGGENNNTFFNKYLAIDKISYLKGGRKMRKRGFTLIELIVVIAVIGILAAIIAPNAFKAIEKGKIAAAESDYKSIKTGSMSYYADTGQWPADGVTGTTSPNPFMAAPAGVSGWDGPYLEKFPARNPWGGAYTWNNDSAIDWTGDGTADAARYVTLSNVSPTSANKIDLDLDGTAGATSGTVIYTTASGVSTVNILVARD